MSSPVDAGAMAPRTEDERAPLRGAKERTGSGVVPVLGVLMSLLLLGLAVALVRDALVLLGVLGGAPWLQTAVEAVRGTAPATWTAPAGAALALLGLWLLSRAFARRSRDELRLRSRTAVTTRPRDVARLSSAAARDVDGVLRARTSATRRAVSVAVTTTGGESVGAAVQQAVTDRLAPLERRPSVRVRVEGGQP
ncbi:DUF6286 domain-containing protein [uncultured Pseudokineococcus sp.]|uniref:DUF6286 domain-containing protein n=1 Tax=uncultured Pseudokineococcus sp. TaxID=1642928 RepID=UPI0026283A16|nr:DUF6286 domain-containing protein [uncultured Pseudokineococcus sp.]